MNPQDSGQVLKRLREQSRISQAELAHRVGVSQRHLSCIETSKAQPSREMLVAILDALEPPLADRNQSFLAFGYAPVYPSRTLEDGAMNDVSQVIDLMLSKHEPFPAIVLDADWNLLRFNGGVLKLFELLGMPVSAPQGTPNLIEWMLAPGGLLTRIVNRDEVVPYLLRRLQAEAMHLPQLQPLLASVPQAWMKQVSGLPSPKSPTLITRFGAVDGQELAFMTTITTFGTPLDITVESLRIELLYPVNEAARLAFQSNELHTVGSLPKGV
ncbi:MAG: helix-turn-helix domain-containing protein [Limnobacter sp.]|uniref:helix-turn-helix domain-containing protein n=1 Tax=Limnobacter sp. TaxID=2003368 RepID=UPI00391DAB83